jgi:Flp pilus assembly protein TadG
LRVTNLSRLRSRLGDRGSISAEFAMIAPAFLLLTLAIFELGYMIFVQSVLDGAARDAARLIRTGQVQANANPQTYFQTQLCSEMAKFVGCSSLVYSVQTFASWSSAQTTMSQPVTRNASGTSTSTGWTPGTASQIVAVQVTYNRSFITPWVIQYLGSSYGTAFLSSTVVFQNEPFPTSS